MFAIVYCKQTREDLSFSVFFFYNSYDIVIILSFKLITKALVYRYISALFEKLPYEIIVYWINYKYNSLSFNRFFFLLLFIIIYLFTLSNRLQFKQFQKNKSHQSG